MELRSFQIQAVNKLASVPARLLGDDMGLGKTVEAIALDKETRKQAEQKFPGAKNFPTLVIAPMSCLDDPWASHFETWDPGRKICVIDRRNRTPFANAIKKNSHDTYICHWDVLRLMPELTERRWLHVIADEVHRAGNRDSQQTQALKAIKTLYKTGASGTPAQTRPQDLWSILNWLYPKKFSSYWRFFNYYVIQKTHTAGWCTADGCEKYHKRQFREILGIANEDELHDSMKDFYIRRLKEEVAPELPDKYYSTVHVDLDPSQRRAYNQMRDDMLAWIGEHENEPLAAPAAIAKLVRLQQLSAAYAEIRQVWKGAKQSDGSVKRSLVDV